MHEISNIFTKEKTISSLEMVEKEHKELLRGHSALLRTVRREQDCAHRFLYPMFHKTLALTMGSGKELYNKLV